MDFHPATSGTVGAFLAICIAVMAAFITAVSASERRDSRPRGRRLVPVVATLVLWLAAVAIVVRSGWVAVQPMPRLMLFAGGCMLVPLCAGLLAPGRWLATTVPLGFLVGFQAFRLPLELVLHEWAAQGTIPGTMTWTGQNWDIVTGVVSVLAAPFAGRSRAVAWTANLIGAVLLLNVFRVVVLSSPLPFAWPVTPPLLLAFNLPYALIVPVCVGGALFGHIVLTRALLGPEESSSASADSSLRSG